MLLELNFQSSYSSSLSTLWVYLFARAWYAGQCTYLRANKNDQVGTSVVKAGVDVRLADWVISCSLEINSGCLRYLAESHVRGESSVSAEPEDVGLDTQAIYTESLLARDSRKILSHWRLLSDGLEASESLQNHISALSAVVDQLTDDPAPLRLAMRLAGQAPEEEQAQLMLRLGRSLPSKPGPDWASLNELFASDSLLWRDSELFDEIDDEFLSRRIGRDYRAAYKILKRLPGHDWAEEKVSEALNEDLESLSHHVQLASHHMELLRVALSDKQKHQLWYLDKLANALRMRHGLRELMFASRGAQRELGKKPAKLARKYLAGQESKVNKRIQKLFAGTFTMKPKKFTRQLTRSIDQMGLASVAKVSSEEVKPTATVVEVAGVSVRETMPDDGHLDSARSRH